MLPTAHTVQALVENADDACRRRDLRSLATIARSLISRVPHPLQFDMVAVSELAALDEPFACDRWLRLRSAIAGATAPISQAASVA